MDVARLESRPGPEEGSAAMYVIWTRPATIGDNYLQMADASTSKISETISSAKKPRKRFIGNKSVKPSKPGAAASIIANQISQDILSDDLLNEAIMQLPVNYSFEIHKTIHYVRKNNATMVALQMPEGLQMYACTIADIIEK